MFENFRRKPEPGIKYNDTNDYQYLEVTGVLGVFTKQNIDPDTLPNGFAAFSMFGAPEFNRIAPAGRRRGEGTFICKESESSSVGSGRGRIRPEDYIFQEGKPFDFREYFGSCLSIECKINWAEGVRLQQLGISEKDQESRADSAF